MTILEEAVARNALMRGYKDPMVGLLEHAAFHAELAPLEQRFIAPLRAIIEQDPGAVAARKAHGERLKARVNLLKGRTEPLRATKRPTRSTDISPERSEPGIARVPPYDYTWSVTNPGPSSWLESSASIDGGFGAFVTAESVQAPGLSGGPGAIASGSAGSGVGIYYQPETEYTDVLFDVNADGQFNWMIFGPNDPCGSYTPSVSGATINVVVFSYDLSGKYLQTLLDQSTSLWYQTEGFSFSSNNAESNGNVTIPLGFTLYGMSNTRQYIIWFFINVWASAAGGGSPISSLNVLFQIPQILIEEGV